MKKYQELVHKFLDKGYREELFWFVPRPMLFDPSVVELQIYGREKALEIYYTSVGKVYGKDWDYWNAWIDTQLPKF